MDAVVAVGSFRVPLGGQQIELQHIEIVGGAMCLLRVRIREGNRFTVFDIDAGTAERWGGAMKDWACTQPGSEGDAP